MVDTLFYVVGHHSSMSEDIPILAMLTSSCVIDLVYMLCRRSKSSGHSHHAQSTWCMELKVKSLLAYMCGVNQTSVQEARTADIGNSEDTNYETVY